MYEKDEDLLRKHGDCDIFVAPLAGNSAKHIAEKGGKMVDLLEPKVVVPLHWDDFYPPISRQEDLEPFHGYMKEKHPNVEVALPEIDAEMELSPN